MLPERSAPARRARSAMTAPIIHVADVRKTYGRGQSRFEALKG